MGAPERHCRASSGVAFNRQRGLGFIEPLPSPRRFTGMIVSHVENYRKAWGFAEQDTVLCERCCCPAGEIHHIVYRSHGGGDEFENLIGLCVGCHRWAHGRADRAETLRKLKRWPPGWKTN
jgi:5-methylcytosine-specific restriction endonuclease McrA